MIRSTTTRLGLAAALAISIPAASVAQDEAPTLEGAEWHLIGYAVEGEVGIVPWYVHATLLLEDGTATGSAGCNRFSGSYTLDGEDLGFDPALAVTRMACAEEGAMVEDGYMAALPHTATWTIEDGVLSLADAEGGPLLDFEGAVIALTASDIAALAAEFRAHQARIDQLDERLDNIKIGVLRERIKKLEAQAAKSSGPDLSAFNAAEKVLLGAVRKDIARTCEPRRSQNPAGTVAALQCKPDAPEVLDMAYYLMEGDDAWNAYSKRMKQYDVKFGTPSRACAFGKPSEMAWTGAGLVGAGCYRNEDGRANLRFTNTATECRQLKAGKKQLKSPHLYVAVLGPDKDIADLWDWAASSTEWEAGEDLFDPITQNGQPWSPMCPS